MHGRERWEMVGWMIGEEEKRRVRVRGKRAPSRNDCRTLTLVHRREISPSSPSVRHTPQNAISDRLHGRAGSQCSPPLRPSVHILQVAFPPSTWT